ALVLEHLEEVRSMAELTTKSSDVRAIIAPYIPSQVVNALASVGIASFQADDDAISALGKQKKLSLPKTSSWGSETAATAGRSKVQLRWLAVGAEQGWTEAGRSTAAKA
ncbi:MAG: 3-isopropylmalate dehydratase, partial [Myxococcota bacterium]